jgi:hypothetical protein
MNSAHQHDSLALIGAAARRAGREHSAIGLTVRREPELR